MSKKNIIALLVVIILAALGWFFRERLIGLLPPQTLEMIQKDISEQAYLPPPLRSDTADKPEKAGPLTVLGTISETNRHRALNSLPPLHANERLKAAAEMKIDDMFDRQYFAHESPTGKGPSDLATEAEYEYVIVGENLALGNFEDDAELVQAWMNSPGHRANILNNRYSEIGVAVRQGYFEGKTVWLAVQEFGLPASACPSADRATGILIDTNKKRLDQLEKDIDARRAELESMGENNPEYNARATEYNRLVREYNDLVERTKKLTAQYNETIKEHNECLQAAGTNGKNDKE